MYRTALTDITRRGEIMGAVRVGIASRFTRAALVRSVQQVEDEMLSVVLSLVYG